MVSLRLAGTSDRLLLDLPPGQNALATLNTNHVWTGCYVLTRIPVDTGAANGGETMDHPKLRPIEAFPVNLSGHEVICLRDPAQLTDDVVFVPHEALFILAHFDGKHSILDIQEAYTHQYGRILYSDAIQG